MTINVYHLHFCFAYKLMLMLPGHTRISALHANSVVSATQTNVYHVHRSLYCILSPQQLIYWTLTWEKHIYYDSQQHIGVWRQLRTPCWPFSELAQIHFTGSGAVTDTNNTVKDMWSPMFNPFTPEDYLDTVQVGWKLVHISFTVTLSSLTDSKKKLNVCQFWNRGLLICISCFLNQSSCHPVVIFVYVCFHFWATSKIDFYFFVMDNKLWFGFGFIKDNGKQKKK